MRDACRSTSRMPSSCRVRDTAAKRTLGHSNGSSTFTELQPSSWRQISAPLVAADVLLEHRGRRRRRSNLCEARCEVLRIVALIQLPACLISSPPGGPHQWLCVRQHALKRRRRRALHWHDAADE